MSQHFTDVCSFCLFEMTVLSFEAPHYKHKKTKSFILELVPISTALFHIKIWELL